MFPTPAPAPAPAMRRLLPFMFTVVVWTTGEAQANVSPSMDLPHQTLSLANLTGFQPASANWKLASNASAERSRPLGLTGEPGTGVLINSPARGAAGHLSTSWEHGDLDLSFDVMLPKGSSSGVFLMGRYEVQLSDSWGVRVPTIADLGAVDGLAPRQNASRAPGLWQHVDLAFRAPKFVGQRKVANARFVTVMVNSVVVHENVEVSSPTRTAPLQGESANGPLVFEGDRGPVAVRNIRYKRYSGAVTLAGLRYHVFEGETMDSSYVTTHAPVREGDAIALSTEPLTVQDKFAMSYDGSIRVPTAGRYRFVMSLGWIGGDSATRGARIGGGRLTIDDKPVVLHTGAERNSVADVDLDAGHHAFRLTFYKNRPSFNRRDIAVWVEGPGVERQALHAESGPNTDSAPINPIVVEPQMEPVMLRSFVRHRDTKRVIAMSVADPLGVHYSYDLAQGALLFVWRGPFLETTQMWHERGEAQTADPRGSTVVLPGTPALAFLADANAAWPDSVVDEREFRRDGYQLDKTGHPTFLFHMRGVAVEDDIRADADGLSLRRTLRLRAPAGAEEARRLHLQLAKADHITRERDGSYVVGDRSFYIALASGSARPVIRRQNGQDELILPVRFDRGEAGISYSIIW